MLSEYDVPGFVVVVFSCVVCFWSGWRGLGPLVPSTARLLYLKLTSRCHSPTNDATLSADSGQSVHFMMGRGEGLSFDLSCE